MATMVAGTKYRGEFEERMKKVIKEIEDNDDIILFIDEIHTLVGAGGAEGAIDASNILKPALARGKIRCIGATTTDEYKKFIEKDSALERRFQKVFVNEPSRNETRNILMNIKDIYEKYHNVIIDDDMVDYIINLSEKYIFDRNRPDKEIDIMDEVASRVGLRGGIADKENGVKAYEVLETMSGKDLEYKEYEPLFDCAVDICKKQNKKAYYVVCDTYVTLTDGTGVVHIAPAFGEDDAKVGRIYDLPFVQLVDGKGECLLKCTEPISGFTDRRCEG